ncbi:hypothetical protein PIB30_042578 [Stylosanthes scabra]|uniref:Uncharacterized protein n=1 Tax=Stylosanthes scabra TaxID=79078 RepID=A0ABU6RFG0_9FABA|nr:hypothetical protein [Stylosanthes scabra]
MVYKSDDSFLDDELEFHAKKLRKLLKSRGGNKELSSSKEYKKKKMKVLMEYWNDLENESDSEDEDEQEAQVCSMADNEVIDEVSFNELSNDNLQVVIDDLTAHANKLFERCNKCKYENPTLKNENGFLKEKLKETEGAADLLKENRFLKSKIAKFKGKQPVLASMDLMVENERLCRVIEGLKHDLKLFTNSFNNLDKLLGYQRPNSMESGLGYSAGSDANFETIFVKASASTSNTRNQQPPRFFHRRTARGNHCSNAIGKIIPILNVLLLK